MLGADVTNRTLQQQSSDRAAAEVIRLQMSATQKTKWERGDWMSVCV